MIELKHVDGCACNGAHGEVDPRCVVDDRDATFIVVCEHELLPDSDQFETDPSSSELLLLEAGRMLVPSGTRPSMFRFLFIGSEDDARAFYENELLGDHE